MLLQRAKRTLQRWDLAGASKTMSWKIISQEEARLKDLQLSEMHDAAARGWAVPPHWTQDSWG